MPGDPQLAVRQRSRGPGLRTDPRRRRQGLRSLAGEGRPARPLRHEHLRPVLPGRRGGWWSAASPTSPSTTRAAGTPTSRISRLMRRRLPEMDKGLATLLAGSLRARPARQHHRLVERRIRPHAEGHVGSALERRPQPLGRGLLRPWSPAADSRAARWSARPTPGRRGQGPARLSRDLIGSMYELWASTPRPSCRTRKASPPSPPRPLLKVSRLPVA